MKFPLYIGSFLALAVSLSAQNEDRPLEKKVPAWQKIDSIIEANYVKQGITPNPMASDEVFVRRIYLDIIGRVPTKQETLAFLDSKEKKKRTQLIDELLDSDGYVSHHFNYWADILRARSQINGNGQGRPAGYAYAKWIKESLRDNKPYDQFVREMVTASGSSWENGAVGYYLRDYGMPLDNLAITAQVFLGTEVVCAQCHNHPFDKWTQMDYYHLAAFTYGKLTTNQTPNARKGVEMAVAKVKNKKLAKEQTSDVRRAFSEILKPVRFNNVVDTNRSLRLPRDYQYDDAKPKAVVKPATIFEPHAPLSDAANPSIAFADWITSEKNERFTTVIANRLWKKAFGVGIIEPVDNMTDHSVASNPELLAYLETRMRGFDYDMKRFLRMIYNTKTYQRESSEKEPELGMPYHYPGPVLRRMSAEQIWDSMVAMAVPNPDQPSRAHELVGERALTEVQLIAESIYDQKPADFLRNAYEVAKVQKALSEQIDAARADLTEAQASKDTKRIRAAIAEAQKLRRQLVTEIENRVYREGLEEKIQLVSLNENGDDDSQVFLTELADVMVGGGDRDFGGSGGESSAGSGSMMMGGSYSKGIIRQLTTAMMADEYATLEKFRERRQKQEIKQWGIDTREERSSYKKFNAMRSKLVRASDLPSPSPVGHFLRAFGQSDRELVENANDQASITQALALLNGPAIGGITSRYSVLVRDLSGETFDHRLDTIFLTMLSRYPRAEERAIFKEAWEANPEAGSLQGIVWTVLNMRQFLFVE